MQNGLLSSLHTAVELQALLRFLRTLSGRGTQPPGARSLRKGRTSAGLGSAGRRVYTRSTGSIT